MKKNKREPNYFGLLVVGMMFIVLGLVLNSPETIKPVFIGVGILFLIVSLVNKDKWKISK
jgi:hypothetical protein